MKITQSNIQEIILMALNQSTTGVILSNPTGDNIIFMNQAAEKILNISKKQLINTPIDQVIRENILYNDSTPYSASELPIVRAVKYNEFINSEELLICLPNHKKRWIIVNANPVIDKENKVIAGLATFTDITKFRGLESKSEEFGIKFRQAHNMASISSLAGGIAHEFNNALFEITGNLELLQLNNGNETFLKKFPAKIKKATDRMAFLTKQLLAYSRGGKYQPVKTTLSDFIDKTIPKFCNTPKTGANIKIQELLSSGVIEIDLTQLEMAISSIISNSFESIEENGTIHIKTFDFYADAVFINLHPGLTEGHYSCLNITDTGRGMPIQTIHNIFKPFFTTNFTGRGLGMAAVYGIVKNHKGWIGVNSEPGEGTIIQIYLPILEKKPRDHQSEKKKTNRLSHNKVLIVDNNSISLEINREMVEYIGYSTVKASTTKEARKSIMDKDIIAVIIDYDLPGSNCKSICSEIKEKRPDVKMLLSSSYPNAQIAKEIDMKKSQLLQKPFSLATLSTKLKENIK